MSAFEAKKCESLLREPPESCDTKMPDCPKLGWEDAMAAKMEQHYEATENENGASGSPGTLSVVAGA